MGENGVMKLDKDEDLGAIMWIYVPDMEKMKPWEPPKAEMLR